MSATLRLLESTDAHALVALLPDLGYEASADQLVRRLGALRDWPDQEAFVAELNGAIVGLCHVQGVRLLISEGYAEIQARRASESSRPNRHRLAPRTKSGECLMQVKPAASLTPRLGSDGARRLPNT